MAREYNRFKLDDGLTVTVSDDNTDIQTEINGEIYKLNINTASKKEINDFMTGVGYGRVLGSNLVKADHENQNMPFSQDSGMGNSNQMTQGKQKTLIPPGGRSPYQPQNFEPFQNDNPFSGNMAAFSDRLLIAMLGSFGLGVVAATVYIFVNLGKVTFTL